MVFVKRALHIFPMLSAWAPRGFVTIIVQPDGYSLSDALYAARAKWPESETVVADHLFGALSLPSFKASFDDIIMHGNPFREFQCGKCESPRLALQDEHKQFTCDTCGKSVDNSELTAQPQEKP